MTLINSNSVRLIMLVVCNSIFEKQVKNNIVSYLSTLFWRNSDLKSGDLCRLSDFCIKFPCHRPASVGSSFGNRWPTFWQYFVYIHALWLYKDHGKSFSTSGPYIFPKFQYQWSLCGPYFLQIFWLYGPNFWKKISHCILCISDR